MKRIFTLLLILSLVIAICGIFTGCEVDDSTPAKNTTGSKEDVQNTRDAANELQSNQPTPTDIEYSLERYNLIRRAYWVNGQREKANALPCELEKPLGYIVFFSGNVVVGNFVVDGKVSSLNSFLTPDSEYYEQEYYSGGGSKYYGNHWLADVDGSYGENDNGIFFFTPDGKYIEWNGTYFYSDIPFEVESPVLSIAGGE